MNARATHVPHYCPDARQLQLLRASVSPARAGELWPQIATWLDSGELQSATARLLPLFGHALRAAGIDDPRLAEIDTLTVGTRDRNRHLFEHVAELIACLEARGIATIVLKGAALALTVYDDIGLRPMGDLDVLVPTAAAEEAIEVARANGWKPRNVPDATWRRFYPQVHMSGSDGCQLDLHWHVFHDFASDRDDADLWAAAVPMDLATVPTRRLCAADELLHVCVHGVRWARTPGIRWVADAALIVHHEAIDWSRLVRQARRRRFALRARMTLGYLARQVGVMIPDDVLRALRETGVTPLERLEYAVTSHDQGPLRRLPEHACRFVRTTPPGDLTAAAAFPAYLADAWELPSATSIPRGAAERLWRHWIRPAAT